MNTVEMEIYKANEILASYLLQNSFNEITSAEEKSKGKRRFKRGYNKTILFDYENIKLVLKGFIEFENVKVEKNYLDDFICGGGDYAC